jgi:mRNA interferase MazF
MKMNQYQIVLVNLDPTMGSEIQKTRPCVIISPDEMNRHLSTLIISPITSQSTNYPTRIKVKTGEKNGWVVIDQIRTVDKQRIIKTLGRLTAKEIVKIKLTIRETFID